MSWMISRANKTNEFMPILTQIHPVVAEIIASAVYTRPFHVFNIGVYDFDSGWLFQEGI